MNNIYLNGVRVAASLPNGECQYYLTDQVDSVSVVTDDKASVVNRFEYLPFGESWSTEGDGRNRAKYNSQELDAETNFYFYNARYYDPEIARFVTADNVIDGEYSMQGWNRFMYCHGNPVRYKDPTGHLTESDMSSSERWGSGDGYNLYGQSDYRSNGDIKSKLDKSVGTSNARGERYKTTMVNNMREEKGAWVTQLGGTKMVLGMGGDKDELTKMIKGTRTDTVAVLGDMASDVKLKKLTISSMAREPYNGIQTDPHRYSDSKVPNPGGGRGVDITSASTRKEYGRLQGMVDWDKSFRQETEPSLAGKITSYLGKDPRTSQVFTPWTVIDKGNARDPVSVNRIWSDPQKASPTEWQHKNHIHFGTGQ